MLSIHLEKPQDVGLIYELNQSAFGQANEAELVDALRRLGALSYSLVAFDNSELVGHLAFSPVNIYHDEKVHEALGLAPMAVKPTSQRQGIGTQLFNYWLNNFDLEQHGIVVVLGHPKFYLSLGFLQANIYGIKWEVNVPAEAFMVRELRVGALSKIQGIVKYHPKFNEL
jgi:putative acetyltransferase